MDTSWKSPLSEKIWKKMQFDAKNNIKTPLGLVRLMVVLEHSNEMELEKLSKDTNQGLEQ